MAYPDDGVVQTWLDAWKGLNIRLKKCLAVIVSTVTARPWAG